MTTRVYDVIVSGLRDIQTLLLKSDLFSIATFRLPSKVKLNNIINHVNRVFGLKPTEERVNQPKVSTGRTRERPRMSENIYMKIYYIHVYNTNYAYIYNTLIYNI